MPERESYGPPPEEFSISVYGLTRAAPILPPDPKMHFRELSSRQNVNLIVVHSQQGSVSLADEHWACINDRHWSGIGYHYWIEPDGRILTARPVWTVGAHAVGFNKTSVGICLAGDARKHYWPPCQTAALAVLCLAIAKFNKNLTRWAYHRDVCDTDCPGVYAPHPDDLAAMLPVEDPLFPHYAPKDLPSAFPRARNVARS